MTKLKAVFQVKTTFVALLQTLLLRLEQTYHLPI